MRSATDAPDYYDILQLSRNADFDTIRGVYRFLAAKLHPDNHETGDLEEFLKLSDAYAVLSNQELRARYDAALRSQMRRSVLSR